MENNIPRSPEAAQVTPPPRRSRISSIVTIVILLIALLASGYLYALSLRSRARSTEITSTSTSSSKTEEDIISIEGDLNATDIDNSDREIDSIDSYFQQ